MMDFARNEQTESIVLALAGSDAPGELDLNCVLRLALVAVKNIARSAESKIV
jgi:hypothetical protein